MSFLPQWQDVQTFLEHPIRTIEDAFAATTPITGNPASTSQPWYLGGAVNVQQGDSIVSGAQRAYGVDPITGGLLAPQYEGSARAAGWTPEDPGGFLTKVATDATTFYNDQLAKNTAAANSGPSSSLLLVAVAVLALFLVLKAVK